MNVIFLDFDGVLDTEHRYSDLDIEKRIIILSDICHAYDCKIVIESSHKEFINEDTLESDVDWIDNIFKCFKKYDIKCIGKTPVVKKVLSDSTYLPIWKEDEIIAYLEEHPEIEHFCILDDDDLTDLNMKSDLDKVRDYLVKTTNQSDNYDEEGLLLKHKELVGKVLEKENIFKKNKIR